MADTETQPATARAPRPIAPRFAPDAMIASRYRIVRFIAAGGMGEVYEVVDTTLGASIALKTMRAELAADPAVVRRFRREVELARRVTHEHVCRIFDTGDTDGVPFLTMELLAGETLAARCARGPLTIAEAEPIARALISGLSAAHKAGVIHRDFKTANIVFGDRLAITDFGLARREVADGDASALTGSAIVGTPSYMAPEQVLGEPTGTATDVYSLGVVLYELVTGLLPFRGESPMVTAALRLRVDPVPPRTHVPTLPEAWQRAILGCLRRAPDKRLSLDELRAILDGAPPRRRWPLAMLGVLGLAGGVAVVATRSAPAVEPAVVLKQSRLATGTPGRALRTTMSPDGKRVALVDGGLRVVDTAGGTPRAIALPSGAEAESVSWFRDSTRLLVSWVRDGRAQLVELAEDGTPRVILDGAEGRVSPDGVHLAMVAADGVVVARLDGQDRTVVATEREAELAWSQDGRALAVFGARLRVIDATGARSLTISSPAPLNRMGGVAWLSGGRLVVVGQERPSFDPVLWTLPIDTAVLALAGAPQRLGAFPLQTLSAIESGDGERLTATLVGTTTDVMVLPLAGGEPRRLTDHILNELPLGFSPDGAQLYVREEGRVDRVTLVDGTRTRLLPAWEGTFGLAGETVLSVRDEGVRQSVVELSLDGAIRSRVALPDAAGSRTRVECDRAAHCVLGRELATTTELRWWNRGPGAAIATVSAAPSGGMWALAPDGTAIAVVGPDSTLHVVDTATGHVTDRVLPCAPQHATWLGTQPVVSCMAPEPPVYQLRVVDSDGSSRALHTSADQWMAFPLVDPTGRSLAYAAVDVASRAYVISW